MRRVVLEKLPFEHISAKSKIKFEVEIQDDMGNPSGPQVLLALKVHKILPNGRRLSIFSETSTEFETEIGQASWEKSVDIEYLLESCKGELQNFFVTISAPSSPSILPLTVGPFEITSGSIASKKRPRAKWRRSLKLLNFGAAIDVLEEPNVLEDSIAGSTWDAGVILGAFLAKNWTNSGSQLECSKLKIRPKYVIEVGAGGGVSALALAKSARETLKTLITDGADVAVDLAAKNIEANNLESFCKSVTLNWGPRGLAQCTLTTNWMSEALEPSKTAQRLILAADVVYNEDFFVPLIYTLLNLAAGKSLLIDNVGTGKVGENVKNGGGCVILGYRDRTESKTAQHFFHLLGEVFEVEKVPRTEQHPQFTSKDVEIYVLCPRQTLGTNSCQYCHSILKKDFLKAFPEVKMWPRPC